MDIYLKSIFSKKKEQPPHLKVQIQFLKRLYQLLNNGYSLIDSLQLIQLERNLRSLTRPLKTMLVNGKSLGQALESLSFHPLITNFLKTVESSGNLKTHIKTTIKIAEQQNNYLNKIKEVIRYPLILSVFFLGLFIIINNIVLPSFETMLYTEQTRFFHHGISFIKITLISLSIVALLIMGLYIFRGYLAKFLSIEKRIFLLSKIPYINYIASLHTSFLLSTQLSTLLDSGMTFKGAFLHLSRQGQMPIISYYSKLFIQQFEKGENLIELLQQLPLIDQQLAGLFQNAVNKKQLAQDLRMYEEILFDEIESSIVKLIQIIQPLFFVTLSIFIIFMYLSILWPMFNLINDL